MVSSLLCRWDELIGSSSTIMNAFKINLKPQPYDESAMRWEKRLQQLDGIDRKFVNIEANSLTEKNMESLRFANIIHNHRHTIKSITLQMLDGMVPQTLMNLLSSMENLEEVKLNYSQFGSAEDVKIASLKRLKHLKAYGTELKILRLFSAAKLSSLAINTSRTVGGEYLTEFISAQHELEVINLRSYSESIFSTIFENGTKFDYSQKLRKFKLSYRDSIISNNAQCNFIKFLQLRGSHLRELEMKGVLPSKMLVFIMTSLKSLRKLTVDAYEALKEKDLHDNIHSSSRIEELNLLRFVSEEHQQDAINALLMYEYTRRMPFSGSLRQAQQPVIQKLNELVEEEIVIVDNLGRLLRRNPSIEMLSVNDFNFCSLGKVSIDKLVKVFTETENLKHLELAGDQGSLSLFFNYLKVAEWKNLQTLQISVTEHPCCPGVIREFIFKKQIGVALSCPCLQTE